MTTLQIYALGAIAILAFVTLIWLLSLRLKDASIIDIFWSIGFILLAALYYVLGNGAEPRATLLALLVTLWGTRLALHLLVRNFGRPEDPRYQQIRARFSPGFWWKSYFIVFLAQGLLVWLISAPLLVALTATQPQHLTLLDAIGIALFAFGLTFEALGDWQLMRFKAKPENKGKLLTTGLWRYTRHPNYFGDATLWWGFFAFALAVPGGYWTLFAPIIMTTLLLKVSGVALLERGLKKSKPGYEDYVRRTNTFIPGPPKKTA